MSADRVLCPQRRVLSTGLAQSRYVRDRAQADFKLALTRKAPDIVERASALMTARDQEREAERLLRAHIQKHGCWS